MHTQKMSLNHIISKLIFIRSGRDHKSDESLPYNTTTFIELELETMVKLEKIQIISPT